MIEFILSNYNPLKEKAIEVFVYWIVDNYYYIINQVNDKKLIYSYIDTINKHMRRYYGKILVNKKLSIKYKLIIINLRYKFLYKTSVLLSKYYKKSKNY